MSMDTQKIRLNVGGQRFETNKTTLKKIPASRLSRLTEALGNYDTILDEYFFDRHPGVFSQILNYYRTGKLHYPNNVCGPLFEAELEFWGLDSNQVEPCCWRTFTKHRNAQETLVTLEKMSINEDKTSDDELLRLFNLDEREPLSCFTNAKLRVWQLFYDSNSSRTARAITFISLFFIIISIFTFCLSTVNYLCKSELFCQSYTIRLRMSEENSSTASMINLSVTRRDGKATLLDFIEYMCITWFTFELGVKYIVSPSKIKFFKSLLNWIDFVAILWFYLDIVYNYFLLKSNGEPHPAWDLFGTVRIMRLFRLFNHYPGLKVIIASLKASEAILRLLVFFIGVAVIMFGSLIYYSEKLTGGNASRNRAGGSVTQNQQRSEDHFHSILEAFWFSIASLTTVGFGDYAPKTPLGMMFGAICTVAGVLMIHLPMPIICENFANYYKHLQASSKFPKKLKLNLQHMETVSTTYSNSNSNSNCNMAPNKSR